MSKYCSDCIYLNTEKAKCDGIHQGKKQKEFTCACNNACEKFENSYSRTSYEKQRLYDLGKGATRNSETPIEIYVIILIVIVILFLIAKLLGY